jgi:nucleotide-binding universal stress UspA family protein
LAKKQDNPSLTLLNILDIDTVKKMVSSFVAAPTYGLNDYEEHKRVVLQNLDAVRKKCEDEGIRTKLEVVGGPTPVTSSIVNYAENENIDLLVVGTRGNSGLKKLLLGSIATGVVTYAHCPVLVVK